MRGIVFRQMLAERRRSTLWWTLGLVALGAITVAFVPSVRQDGEALIELFDSLPQGLMAAFGIEDAQALVTAEGLINSRLYAGIGPVLVAVFGIALGVGAVVGPEDRGTLNLLLAQPVRRATVLLEAFAAAVVLTLVVCASLWLLLVVSDPLLDLELSQTGMVAANVGLALVALVFCALALAVGGVTGNRGLTVGVTAAVTVAAFFLNGLAAVVDDIAWTRWLSPFHWLQGPNPLANGFAWGEFALLLATVIVLLTVAVIGFERRDIDV